MWPCVYIYIHRHMYTYIYIYMYICIHTSLPVYSYRDLLGFSSRKQARHLCAYMCIYTSTDCICFFPYAGDATRHSLIGIHACRPARRQTCHRQQEKSEEIAARVLVRHTYTYLHMCIYIYVCICMYAYKCLHMQTCVCHTYIYVYIYRYLPVCT